MLDENSCNSGKCERTRTGEVHLEHEPYKNESDIPTTKGLIPHTTGKQKKIDYQRDISLESSSQDEFKHSHYVDVLMDVLQKAETPLNIGLYGRWGVGKSSILNMLKEKLQTKQFSKEFKYLYVNAWGLSADTLKQEILVSINNELGRSSPYTSRAIEDKLYNVREESVVDLNAIMNRGWPFFLLMTIGGIFGYVLDVNGVFDFSDSLIISAVISVVTAGAKFLTEKSRRIIPRVASSHQFNAIYDKMIKSQNKKLVVVIDNLDRCDAEVAVALLGLIQTFMTKPNCFNILACDDQAIVNHLAEVKGEYYTEREGNEFLSKFFQVTIIIPPFIGENLQVYVERLMGQRTIPLSANVKHVLISGAIKNPRKVNQFLNNVVAMYRLAQHKEKSKKIRAGLITNNTDFLTKMIIIRHEWPNFYKLLEQNPSLLHHINTIINERDPIEILPQDNKLIIAEWKKEGIKEFLNATQFCIVPDTKPFLRLNQESFEGELEDVDSFQYAVERNNVSLVLEKLRKADEKEKEKYIKKMCFINEGYANEHAIPPLLITTRVLIKALEIIENELIKDTGLLNLGHCLLPILKENYQNYDLNSLFDLVKQMGSYYHEQFYKIFTDLVQVEKDLKVDVVKILLNDNVKISTSIVDKFDTKLSELLRENEAELLEIIVEVCGSDNWNSENFSKPPIFLRTLIGRMVFDASDIDKRRIEVYSKIRNNLAKTEKELFILHLQKLIEKFIEAPTTPPPPTEVFEVIYGLDFKEYVNMDHAISQLFGSLTKASKHVSDQELQKKIFEVLIKLLTLSGEET